MATRLAIIDHDKCKPNKCNKECKRGCPIELQGKQCIDIENVAIIYEEFCIGCGQCVKRCPFGAINIVNIPTEIKHNVLFTYTENSYRLYRFPMPKIGKIYGIIGKNGIGKSSLLGLLSGQLKPNFGNYTKTFETNYILKKFRGTELQVFLKRLYDGNLKTIIKHQNIEAVQRNTRKKYPDMTVKNTLNEYFRDNDPFHQRVINELRLDILFDSKVINLSGGEMQRLVCAVTFLKDGDIYIFDEPSNYLDVKQRLAVGKLIKELNNHKKYIFIVEHDMSILDYVADIISVMYGVPGAYGVVSLPYNTAEAINIFFNGYIPSENMKFRQESYNFNDKYVIEYEEEFTGSGLEYDNGLVKFTNFQLSIKGGTIPANTFLIQLVGQNGTGKTTFLNWLCSTLDLTISYKNQYTDITKFIDNNGLYPTVQCLLYNRIKKSMCSSMFMSDIVKPLEVDKFFEKKINILSGGELQRLSICLCLGKDADIYLLDEPSASLDIEQRVITTKILKRFLLHNNKKGVIVEHDMTMIVSLGIETHSKMIVFKEINNEKVRECVSSEPLDFLNGINKFLRNLDVTFRKDNTINRPRINKYGSTKDSEQKKTGKYFN